MTPIFLFVMFVHPLSAREPVVAQFLSQLKEKDYQIQTGDLLLWSSGEIDSIIIQKFTDGPYSHAGIIWVDRNNKAWLVDVHPGVGIRKEDLVRFIDKHDRKFLSLALVHYKGSLDRHQVSERILSFVKRKDQIKFDQSMGLEEGADYRALREGQLLRLYCTELIYRIYEGLAIGAPVFENDYDRVYDKKELIAAIPQYDQDVIFQFQKWLGLKPVEQFKQWITSHQSQVLISVNGMLRSGGYDTLVELKNPIVLMPWAVKFLKYDPNMTPGGEAEEEKIGPHKIKKAK